MKSRALYVPANVSIRNEVWRGLSAADAAKCVLNSIIATGIAIALHFSFGVGVTRCVFIVVLAGGISFVVLARFDSGLSIMDYIKIMLKFAKEQKRYHYVYRRNK